MAHNNRHRRRRQVLSCFPTGTTVLVRGYGIGTIVAGTRSSYMVRIDRPGPGQDECQGITVLVTDLTAVEMMPSSPPRPLHTNVARELARASR